MSESKSMNGKWSHRLSAVIFYALLTVLCLSLVPYASVEPWWGGLFNASVLLLTALWAVEGALTGRWFSRAHLLLVAPLLLAVFVLLQSAPLPGLGAISFDPYESRLTAVRLAAWAACAALLLRYTDTERRLRALVVTLILIGAGSALFGIVRQAAQREEVGFLLPLLRRGEGYAQFINRNSFAFLAEMAFGLAAGGGAGMAAVGGGAGRAKSLAYAAAALPLWASLVLSNSRGGLFAMLCQVVFLAAAFFAMRPGRGSRAAARGAEGRGSFMRSWAARAVAALLVFCVVAVGAVWLGGDPLADRVETVRQEVGPGQGDPARVSRADIWKDTLRLATHHPLAGVGLGGYAVAVRGYHAASGQMAPQQAHNEYLELAASAGVVGLALLALFVVPLFRRARARLRDGTPFARAAALGAIAGIVGVAAHSVVDFGLHVTGNALFFAALVALATVETRPGPEAFAQKTSLSNY